ncbi:MAG: hypothetical protein L0H20_13465 [Corynebacterium sp.]|uniref:hypothetical protein n=1 Tax=Corynebacterium sp. TaxID=1720 RepID=UPI0026499401|nr:hypothetical protein [Corynebacterium sp.]MDN5723978.1 hypothetical protein [Corynebacterium sp.]
MNATDITAGTASLRGVDITDMEIEERAQAGIGLAFQRPPALAGVSVAKLAHAIGASDRLGAAEDALGLGPSAHATSTSDSPTARPSASRS